MKRGKYMGMDVHQAMTVVAVMDADGKVVLETMVPTEASAIIGLVQLISGPVHVTFEETTQAEWLYDAVRSFATEVIVCDPRHNKLLREGSKGDKIDARKLADLLRTGMLRACITAMKAVGGSNSSCGDMKHYRRTPNERWFGSKPFFEDAESAHQAVRCISLSTESSGCSC